MKTLKTLLAIAIAALIGAGIFYACKKDQYSEHLNKNSRKSNSIYEELRQYMCEGLISFKDALHPYYEQTENYNDFCELLNVKSDNITLIGSELLQLGYLCLEGNYSDEYIREQYTGKWMAQVFKDQHVILSLHSNDFSYIYYLFGIDNYTPDNPLGEHFFFILQDIWHRADINLLQGFGEWLLNDGLFNDQSLSGEFSEETIQNDITYFQEKYGVDIVGDVIYNNDYSEMITVLNDFSSGLYENFSSMNSGQLSILIEELTPLAQWQSYYYNRGEYEKFLEISEEIYRLAFPWMPENPFIYEETGRLFNLPTDYLSDIQEKLIYSQNALFASYPQCNNMSENDYTLFLQTAFLASSLYGDIKLDILMPDFLPQQNSLQSCINDAKAVKTASLALATGEYGSSVFGCGRIWNPVGVGLCVIGVSIIYGIECALIQKSYSESVELCNLKYGK